MPFQIQLNGAEFTYNIAGPEDGSLMILLHGGRGFGDHRSDFQAFSPLASTFRLLAFDFRGHGRSSLTPPYTFAQLVEDIEAFRAHFNGDAPFILSGGSFGGFLAQQYAITYPDKVSHLILRGTAPSYHHEAEALATFQERLHKSPTASIGMVHKVFSEFEDDEEFRLIMFALGPLYTENYDSNAGLMKIRNVVFNAETHNALYSEKQKYFDYREELHKITAKTLILVGEFDWICPPSQSRAIAERIPSARLIICPNTNHSVHIEKNDYFTDIVRHFILKN